MLKLKNDGATTLATDINSSVTRIEVTDGTVFPELVDAGDWFPLTLIKGSNVERMRVTARAGNTLTVIRKEEGTNAQPWVVGDNCTLAITAGALAAIKKTVDTINKNNTSDAVSGAAVYGHTSNKALFSEGAGLNILSPAGGGVDITSRFGSVTVREIGEPISLVKNVGVDQSWYAFYIRIAYTNLSDLNKALFLNFKEVSGSPITRHMLMVREGDWSPLSYGISIPKTGLTGSINLYDLIMGGEGESFYTSQNELFILLSGGSGSSNSVDNIVSEWTVEPQMESKKVVLASSLTPALRSSVINSVVNVPSAKNAGFEILQSGEGGYELDTNRSGMTLISSSYGEPLRIIKGVTTSSERLSGAYFKIPYTNILDLDKQFKLNFKHISGHLYSNAYIFFEMGDWNPTNGPIGGLSSNEIKLDGFNIYNKIINSSLQSGYEARSHLYIFVGSYDTGSGGVSTYKSEWTIQPRFMSNGDVIASELAPALESNLTTKILSQVNTTVADLTGIPKQVMMSTRASSFGTDNAVISSVYTTILNSVEETIGYELVVQGSSYAYASAKLFNDFTTEAFGRTLKFYVSSNGKEVDCIIRFTNNMSWGSSDGLTKSMVGYTLTLNALNNYETIIEVVYDQTMADKYAETNVDGDVVRQEVYYIVGFDGQNSHVEPTTLTTYCYDVNAGKDNAKMTSPYIIDIEKVATELVSSVATIESDVEVIKSDISELKKGSQILSEITCWGDSLTAGGGWTTTIQSLSGITVYNGGTGGENSRTIMARQGGDVMLINNITIPADKSPVLIADRDVDGGIKTAFGATVTPLYQGGGGHVNPCRVGDIEGSLSWTGTSYADTTGDWMFTRSIAGEEVVINRPTALRTAYDMAHNGDVQIIFMGQNGGYKDIDDLIWQHRMMIEHSTAKHTLVLGLSTGTAASRSAYEVAMKAEFGRYFISLREYLATPIYDADGTTIISSYGLDDANITPTEDDLDKISYGQIPPTLSSDGTHWTTSTKVVIGVHIYNRMRDLNIV